MPKKATVSHIRPQTPVTPVATPPAWNQAIGSHVEDTLYAVKGLTAVLMVASTAIKDAERCGEEAGDRAFVMPEFVFQWLDRGMRDVIEAMNVRLDELVDIAYRDTTPEAEARFAARDAAVRR